MNNCDYTARQKAIDVTQSFIVQAPAGSGKTTLLTQRFLTLLAVVEKDPEECLALTFTRKAAGEMRDRILQALAGASSSVSEANGGIAAQVLARDVKEGWNLLLNPHRLRIQTIDSLCAHINRQAPIVSKLGGVPKVVENAELLYRKASQNFLESIEENPPWAPHLRTLLIHLNNHWETTERLLAEMLSKREQWLPYIGEISRQGEGRSEQMRQQLESSLETIVRETLTSVMQASQDPSVIPLISELKILQQFSQENLATTSEVDVAFSSAVKSEANLELSEFKHNLDYWNSLANLIFTQENEVRKIVTAKQGFPAPSRADKDLRNHLNDMKQRMHCLLEQCTHAIEANAKGCDVPLARFIEELLALKICPPITYTDLQWEVVEALIQLLPNLVAELIVVFQEEGETDFAEISLGALRALDARDPTQIAITLDHKIRHILVDEFQDTSIAQMRLFERLMSGWQPNDGRTVFLVGDPMQSIYRFRQAEVGLFLRAKHEGIAGIPLIPLQLSRNFRSDPLLVDWVSQYFMPLFPKSENIQTGAVRFHASEAARDFSDPFAEIKADLIKLEENDESERNVSIEPQQMAQTIKELVLNCREKDPSGSIALLVRQRSQLKKLLPALKQLDVDYHGVEIDLMLERSLIQDLLTFTRALIHLGDRVAWLALFRTPWCTLSLQDLYQIAQVASTMPLWWALERYETIPTLSAEGKQCLARVVPILAGILAQRRRLPLVSWVEEGWHALLGLNSLESNNSEANAFFKILEEQSLKRDILDLGAINEVFQNKYAKSTRPSHAQKFSNPLQVMTIHKSKGLEFDTVIFYGMEQKTKSDTEQLLLWEERIFSLHSALILAPIRAKPSPDPIYHYLKRCQQQRTHHEELRLRYVALTRAKKRLYCF